MTVDEAKRKVAIWLFWRIFGVLFIAGGLVFGLPTMIAGLIFDIGPFSQPAAITQSYLITRGILNTLGGICLLVLVYFSFKYFVGKAIGEAFGEYRLELVNIKSKENGAP